MTFMDSIHVYALPRCLIGCECLLNFFRFTWVLIPVGSLKEMGCLFESLWYDKKLPVLLYFNPMGILNNSFKNNHRSSQLGFRF